MSDSLAELEQKARALSPDDRGRLAEVLLESLQETRCRRSKPPGIERSKSASRLTIAAISKLLLLRTFSQRLGATLGETSISNAMTLHQEKQMKTLAVVVASAFNLIVFGNVYAHGDHPSEHGGVVGRGDDAIVVEFVMEKGTINVYVHDEAGKPLATKNVTGTLLSLIHI